MHKYTVWGKLNLMVHIVATGCQNLEMSSIPVSVLHDRLLHCPTQRIFAC